MPTSIAPEATRAPPTLNTARKAIWAARPAVLPATAIHFAARTLARQASHGGASHPLALALLGAGRLDGAERAKHALQRRAHGAD